MASPVFNGASDPSAAQYEVGADVFADVLSHLFGLAEASAERSQQPVRPAPAGRAACEADERVRHAVKLYSLRQAFRLGQLASAARLLELHYPAVLGKFCESKDGSGGLYWRFSLPGVLSVHEMDTGRCLVRSVAGRLTVIDEGSPDEGLCDWLTRHDAGWAAELINRGSTAAAQA